MCRSYVHQTVAWTCSRHESTLNEVFPRLSRAQWGPRHSPLPPLTPPQLVAFTLRLCSPCSSSLSLLLLRPASLPSLCNVSPTSLLHPCFSLFILVPFSHLSLSHLPQTLSLLPLPSLSLFSLQPLSQLLPVSPISLHTLSLRPTSNLPPAAPSLTSSFQFPFNLFTFSLQPLSLLPQLLSLRPLSLPSPSNLFSHLPSHSLPSFLLAPASSTLTSSFQSPLFSFNLFPFSLDFTPSPSSISPFSLNFSPSDLSPSLLLPTFLPSPSTFSPFSLQPPSLLSQPLHCHTQTFLPSSSFSSSSSHSLPFPSPSNSLPFASNPSSSRVSSFSLNLSPVYF